MIGNIQNKMFKNIFSSFLLRNCSFMSGDIVASYEELNLSNDIIFSYTSEIFSSQMILIFLILLKCLVQLLFSKNKKTTNELSRSKS